MYLAGMLHVRLTRDRSDIDDSTKSKKIDSRILTATNMHHSVGSKLFKTATEIEQDAANSHNPDLFAEDDQSGNFKGSRLSMWRARA